PGALDGEAWILSEGAHASPEARFGPAVDLRCEAGIEWRLPDSMSTANAAYRIERLDGGWTPLVTTRSTDGAWLHAGTTRLGEFRVVPGPSGSAASPGREAVTASPNPARGVATIRCVLPAASRVDLALYDVHGRRIATLARGAWDAGTREISWNTRD